MMEVKEKAEKKYPPFSVLMCVYGGDNSKYFDTAFESIVDQTIKPNEIVLVVDGPIPVDTEKVIEKYEYLLSSDCMKKIEFRIIRLVKNVGHGNARRSGLEACSYELVAIMDSDDISRRERFEKQLSRFKNDPELSIVGSNIEEFVDFPEHITGMRCVPEEDLEIKEFLKVRCPFNQQTVLLKKADVQRAGGYVDWYYNEDYYLWIRMYQSGMKFANIPEALLLFRTGKDMYKRRGGWKYFRSEWKLQKYMHEEKIISTGLYIRNVGKRFVVQILMTSKLREQVYQKFARGKKEETRDY